MAIRAKLGGFRGGDFFVIVFLMRNFLKNNTLCIIKRKFRCYEKTIYIILFF